MKKTLTVLVALLAGLNTAAYAADTGSASRGAAKAFFCTGCHGYNGMGTYAVPELAGRDAGDLMGRLGNLKKKATAMAPMFAKFNEEDFKDLVAHFSALPKTGRGEASYARDIQPIIHANCISCHSADGEGAKKSGLNMSSYEDLMDGTKQGGALVVAGSPANSSFMVMVTRKDHLRMPYGGGALADDEIRVIRAWIEQGAKKN